MCSMADGSSPQARPAPKHCPSFWSQLTALSSRLLRNTTRHPFIIALNFTATLLLAITLAIIFYNAGELVPGSGWLRASAVAVLTHSSIA